MAKSNANHDIEASPELKPNNATVDAAEAAELLPQHKTVRIVTNSKK